MIPSRLHTSTLMVSWDMRAASRFLSSSKSLRASAMRSVTSSRSSSAWSANRLTTAPRPRAGPTGGKESRYPGFAVTMRSASAASRRGAHT